MSYGPTNGPLNRGMDRQSLLKIDENSSCPHRSPKTVEESGDFPFVGSYVRTFIHTPLWAIQPGLRPSQPGLRLSQPGLPLPIKTKEKVEQGKGTADHLMPLGYLFILMTVTRHGWLGLRPGWLGLRPGWLGLRPGWMAQRGGRTDVRTYERTENLPILQDFVPYRGRCPKKKKKNVFRLSVRPSVRPSVPPSGPSSQA